MVKHIFSFLACVCVVLACAAQQLVVYPSAGVLPSSGDFSVRVRVPGQPWQDLPVYLVKVADGTDPVFVPRESSMAYFDFSGTVEVSVSCRRGAASGRIRSMSSGSIGSLSSARTGSMSSGRTGSMSSASIGSLSSARIRPLSYGIHPVISGNTLRFSLDRPRNLSIEIDGDIFHNLQLFAGAPPAYAPDRADSNTIYYGPGIHRVGTVRLTSGKKVYLAGGSVVEGQFLIDHQENVHIGGRGILYQPPAEMAGYHGRHDALKIDFSRNVTISDIIVVPATYTVLMGSSRQVQIKGIRSFSAGGNNDGIDVFCCEDVLIDDVYMRNSDDCIAVYGHRWDYYGNTRNVRVVNSTLWADIAHPVLVGTHGDPSHPDTLENLQFANIDILDHHENQVDYQGCISLDAGDDNLIRRVRCDDIRVEDFRKGQLFNLRVMFNKKYNTAPGRGIEDVVFKNITYNGSHAGLSIIAGYDEGRAIKNILFENLRINGVLVWDKMPGKPGWYKTSDFAGFYVGEHVEGLRFGVGPGEPGEAEGSGSRAAEISRFAPSK